MAFLTLISRVRLFNVSEHKLQVGWILFVGVVQYVLVHTSTARYLWELSSPLLQSSTLKSGPSVYAHQPSLVQAVLVFCLHLLQLSFTSWKRDATCDVDLGAAHAAKYRFQCVQWVVKPVSVEGSACVHRTAVTKVTIVWPIRTEHLDVSVILAFLYVNISCAV